MNAELLAPGVRADVEPSFLEVHQDSLEAIIQRRLGSRIRDVRVLRLPAGLIIQGRTKTYYAKQLATHAVLELADEPILANDIEVM